MPPAAWKWFTSARAVGVDPASAAAPTADRSDRSSQVSVMPAARAIATRCIVWLVEPPVASSATQRVDDRLLVDDLADRGGLAAGRGDRPPRAPPRRRVRASRSGVPGLTKVAPGQVQAHAPPSAAGWSWRCRRRCRCRRSGTTPTRPRAAPRGRPCPRRTAGAPAAFSLVGQARGHRPGRHEDRRQVAEGQRADQQAGHDLVADAEHQRGVEHVVRERDRGRHRDHVAAEERELHAVAALGDAVAHRGHAAGDLGDAAGADDGLLEHRAGTSPNGWCAESMSL